MILYHGTNDRNIDYFKIISRTDNPPEFGDGVYLTRDYRQALEWSCSRSQTGAVYVFDVDLDSLEGIDLRDSKNNEQDLFYYTTYLNRIDLRDIANECLDDLDNTDYLYGDVIKSVKAFKILAEMFNCGDIDKEEFIRTTKTFERYEQYCFRTGKAIDVLNEALCRVEYTKKKNGIINVQKKSISKSN